ncbi:uncharacterized protein PFL1_04132 [Pseudozyma flocculosa PF-1]|uniref:mRNA export factor GLE1 n=2 Tax=Pseudozyma flocculosa TaxID=84751 RepID=A0A5C3ETQ7_9BASI|nr:uncharacterized protein PFL1_04132 [Pseudozyma flocculosa PF-1]EPQ28305.1 hypothetical protein PFL1_04132 [Pseudozyma flocculosa PF-1]SPO35452.1 related to GLE1 - RNA export mediator [Pseudozyma flocculosa]
MRFGIETSSSSSELSADEGRRSATSLASPATPTPSKGILRKVGSPHLRTPASTPRPPARFDGVSPSGPAEAPSHSQARPTSASSRSNTPSAASRRRAESPYVQVGLQDPANPRPHAGPSRRASAATTAAPLPPWLRPDQHLRSLTGVPNDDSLGSSDDDEYGEDSSSDASSSSLTSGSPKEAPSDSEEDEWPVEPGRLGTGIAGTTRAARASHARRKRDLARRLRLASVADDWEDWDRLSRESALSRATSTYVHRLRSYTAPFDDRTSTSNGSPLQQQRAKAAVDKASLPHTGATSSADADLDEVRKLLSTLSVRREDEERREKEAFEARNRLLWQGIDASILAAEKEAQESAAAEAQRLAAARKAQEEAERRAREERESEQRRIEAENKARDEEAAKRKVEEEERQKAEAEARQRSEKEKAMGGVGDEVRRGADKEYEAWMAKIGHIKQNILPTISRNPELRKQCFAAKRQITPKVGQLTNSREEITRITNAIGAVLSSAKAASPTGEIYTWILNHLSKCLIRQAEQETAAKQDTAYPLARVVVWLLLQGHTELGEVLMARLAKKCCWCLAVWPGKRKDQDDESYRKALGYRSNDESSENYSNRMAGIFAFYIAILQTKPTTPPSAPAGTMPDLSLVPEYLRSKTLWTWSVRTLASASPILSHPLLPSLWSTYLEVGGNRALALYGKQMGKVWRLMLDEGVRGKKAGFVQKGEEEGYVKASIVRLELLLEGWEKQGRIVDATRGVEMDLP